MGPTADTAPPAPLDMAAKADPKNDTAAFLSANSTRLRSCGDAPCTNLPCAGAVMPMEGW